MNAPATPAAVATLTAELVPIDTICPSDTHIQQLRRKRFAAAELLELASNIQATHGVLQPILVRPFPKARAEHVKGPGGATPKYELVAGERRWLAATRAGYAHIAAVIRDIDDGDVLLAQMSENKQRNDYTPLEESAGYQDLHTIKKWDAQQIADHIGKSKSYVYARMKLSELAPEGREALQQGTLDFSKALLLARLPLALQPKALKIVTEANWNGDPVSYKRAFEGLREKFMTPLGTAAFALDDPDFFRFTKIPGRKGMEEADRLPRCTDCPSNSANDTEIGAHVGDAHVCTNSECFGLKVVAFAARRRKEAEAQQRPIVSGEAAKEIFPRKNKIVGHVDLDQPCEDDQLPEQEPEATKGESDDAYEKRLDEYYHRENTYQTRTYRQLLGDALKPEQIVLAEDPKGRQLRELVPVKLARELLAKKHKLQLATHIGKPDPKPSSGGQPFDHQAHQREMEARRQRQEAEKADRLAVAKAIAEKCTGPLTREDLVDVADVLSEDWSAKQLLKAIFGKVPEPGQLKDAELGKFIRLALVADSVQQTHTAPSTLYALAKRYKIDAAKIKRDLEAQRKASEKPKTDAPAVAKTAPAKKKPAAKK